MRPAAPTTGGGGKRLLSLSPCSKQPATTCGGSINCAAGTFKPAVAHANYAGAKAAAAAAMLLPTASVTAATSGLGTAPPPHVGRLFRSLATAWSSASSGPLSAALDGAAAAAAASGVRLPSFLAPNTLFKSSFGIRQGGSNSISGGCALPEAAAAADSGRAHVTVEKLLCPKICPPYPLNLSLKGHAAGQVQDMLRGLETAAAAAEAAASSTPSSRAAAAARAFGGRVIGKNSASVSGNRKVATDMQIKRLSADAVSADYGGDGVMGSGSGSAASGAQQQEASPRSAAAAAALRMRRNTSLHSHPIDV